MLYKAIVESSEIASRTARVSSRSPARVADPSQRGNRARSRLLLLHGIEHGARDHRAQGMKRGVSRESLIHQAPQRLFDLCGFACGELVFDDHMEQRMKAPIGHGGMAGCNVVSPSITASRSLSSRLSQVAGSGAQSASYRPSAASTRSVAFSDAAKVHGFAAGHSQRASLDLAQQLFYVPPAAARVFMACRGVFRKALAAGVRPLGIVGAKDFSHHRLFCFSGRGGSALRLLSGASAMAWAGSSIVSSLWSKSAGGRVASICLPRSGRSRGRSQAGGRLAPG